MAPHQVKFTKSARKEFERLPANTRSKTTQALTLLAQDPYSELLKVKKLKGAEALFRIRINDYRVVYEIKNEMLIVLVVKIGHRREVYRR